LNSDLLPHRTLVILCDVNPKGLSAIGSLASHSKSEVLRQIKSSRIKVC
jgi:hypothetical protein